MCVRKGWSRPRKQVNPREFRLTVLLAGTKVSYEEYQAIMREVLNNG